MEDLSTKPIEELLSMRANLQYRQGDYALSKLFFALAVWAGAAIISLCIINFYYVKIGDGWFPIVIGLGLMLMVSAYSVYFFSKSEARIASEKNQKKAKIDAELRRRDDIYFGPLRGGQNEM